MSIKLSGRWKVRINEGVLKKIANTKDLLENKEFK